MESWSKSDAYELAEAVVHLQLKNWEESEQELKKKSDSLEILGLNFGRVQYQSALGEYPEKDSKSIIEAVRESPTVDNGSLNDVWTWSRLPYSIRCAGLKAMAREAGSVQSSDAREKKKSRVERQDELIADADEW